MPTLEWVGKAQVVHHDAEVPVRTVEPVWGYDAARPEARAASGSGNRVIHGDNLEALKALLPELEGRVGCIYIDPPYNTGEEGWVYNDNVSSPRLARWLGAVVGRAGKDLSRDDKWLCMMYPRLKLLRRLLAPDGAIFISIDDNELANLKLVCDEIFGARNYLGLITRRSSSGAKNDTSSRRLVVVTDYVLCYGEPEFRFRPYAVANSKRYPKRDAVGAYSIRALEMQGGGDTLTVRPKMGYSVYYREADSSVRLLFDYDLEREPAYLPPSPELLAEGFKCYRPRPRGSELGIWRWGSETFLARFADNGVHFEKGRIFMKERAKDEVEKWPDTLIDTMLNTRGTEELKSIFGERSFDFPKPVDLVAFLVSVSTGRDSIVLDSFAGSGTTAQAVLQQNAADGGHRRFVLIEMEDYAERLTAERARRVMAGHGAAEGLGGAFDFCRLGESLVEADGGLNVRADEAALRAYVYWRETGRALARPREAARRYFLDAWQGVGYYFYYEPKGRTELSAAALERLLGRERAARCVVYADVCTARAEVLAAAGVTFKKIPRGLERG